MDPVKERLEQLDEEAAALAAEVKDAWKVYKRANNPDDKQHYEDLKEKGKRLDTRRAELETKLPGAGERTPLQHGVSAKILYRRVVRPKHDVMMQLMSLDQSSTTCVRFG